MATYLRAITAAAVARQPDDQPAMCPRSVAHERSNAHGGKPTLVGAVPLRAGAASTEASSCRLNKFSEIFLALLSGWTSSRTHLVAAVSHGGRNPLKLANCSFVQRSTCTILPNVTHVNKPAVLALLRTEFEYHIGGREVATVN